jgi:hypothetical protein
MMLGIRTLNTPKAPENLGFSIGGWSPFGGGLIGALTGGTINGQTVFSGGLAGLAEHLDEIAQGVDVSLLGSDLGGALAGLTAALDAPVIHGTEWVDAHKSVCIQIAISVGIAILAPYAYAAWAAEVGDGAVDAAAAGVDAYDSAMAATDAAATAADDAAIEAAAEAASEASAEAASEAAQVAAEQAASDAAEQAAAQAAASTEAGVIPAGTDSYDAAVASTDASGYDAATAAENISIQNAADQEAANAASDLETAQTANDEAQIANEAGGVESATGGGPGDSMLGTSATSGITAASPIATAIQNAIIGTGTSALIGAGLKAAGLGGSTAAPVTYAPVAVKKSNTLLYVGIAAGVAALLYFGGDK